MNTANLPIDTMTSIYGAGHHPTVTAALSEVRGLWNSTEGYLSSTRDSLYDFLAATHEHALRIADDRAALGELRAYVRTQYTDDKQKTRIQKASSVELLLTAAMGVPQSSLRSKYKTLLAGAV